MNLKLIIADIISKVIAIILPVNLMRWKRRYFSLWESKGYHILPVHYYEPIPDTRTLKDDLWLKHSKLYGVNINEKKQLELLSVFSTMYKDEYNNFPRDKTANPFEYYVDNNYFGSVDGEILYCMIRHFKPRRIIEIGSGYSTLLTAQAILKNKKEGDDYECTLVAIEPYPNDIVKSGFPGLSELISKNVQENSLDVFKKLEENDILFIDSSHVVKIGSDVQYEFLEVLPSLNRGVIVHVHDIFLPAEYPKEWVLEDYKFWNEQYLFQAFLSFNDSFDVLWAGSYIHVKHPQELELVFASYKRDAIWPKSFWIKKMR